MATPYLPQEYQQEIEDAQLKRELAALMLQRGGRSPGGQMVGKHYVRANPLEYLGQALQTFGGTRMEAEGRRDISNVRTRAEADLLKERQNIIKQLAGQAPTTGDNLLMKDDEGNMMPGASMGQAPDPMGAERAALSSKWPQMQELAKSLATQRMDLFKAAAPTSSGQSIQRGALRGGDVGALQPNQWGELSTEQLPNGATAWRAEDQRGGAKMGVAGAPSSVTVGQKAPWEVLGPRNESMLKERPQVMSAAQSIPLLQQVAILAERGGLLQGTGAELVAEIKGLAPYLGLDPNLADTETVRAAAVKQLGEAIKMFGAGTGLSDSDRKAAAALTADPYAIKDPETLKRLTKAALYGTVQTVEDFNRRDAELNSAYETLPGNERGWKPPSNRVEWKSRIENSSPGEQQMLEQSMVAPPNFMSRPAPPAQTPQPAAPTAPRGRRRIDLTQPPAPTGPAQPRPANDPTGMPLQPTGRISPAVLQQWVNDPSLSPEERAWAQQELRMMQRRGR